MADPEHNPNAPIAFPCCREHGWSRASTSSSACATPRRFQSRHGPHPGPSGMSTSAWTMLGHAGPAWTDPAWADPPWSNLAWADPAYADSTLADATRATAAWLSLYGQSVVVDPAWPIRHGGYAMAGRPSRTIWYCLPGMDNPIWLIRKGLTGTTDPMWLVWNDRSGTGTV